MSMAVRPADAPSGSHATERAPASGVAVIMGPGRPGRTAVSTAVSEAGVC